MSTSVSQCHHFLIILINFNFADDETVENNELHQKDKSLTFCYQLFTHTNKKKESSIPR